MTPKQKFIMALEGKQPPGRVPHFELVFYLTMEAFGKVHPTHRRFEQWDQMSAREKDLHRRDRLPSIMNIPLFFISVPISGRRRSIQIRLKRLI